MEKKTQRLTSELDKAKREYAEFLLVSRGQIKRIEATIKTEKDDCNTKLMALLDELGVDKIIGPETNATIATKVSKSLDEEMLLVNLINYLRLDIGIDKKSMSKISGALDVIRLKDLIDRSKVEKESAPFINFTENKKNGK